MTTYRRKSLDHLGGLNVDEAMRVGEAELQSKVHELMTIVHQQIDLAAARLYADGVAIARLKLWSESNSTDRGLMVDDVIVCTISTRLTANACFEVQLAWHHPYMHLADVDPAGDEAKIAELRNLVP
jgi:hypothetical protein